jgi:hypothetical protein
MLLAALTALPLVVGCGRKTVVSGNVTYDGKPVSRGSVKLLPKDGKANVVAGDIVDGHYEIRNVVPGTKTAEVLGVKKISFAATSEEASKVTAKAGKGFDGILERADIIPPDAEGNNVVIEVQPGVQTIDFDLRPPANSKIKK